MSVSWQTEIEDAVCKTLAAWLQNPAAGLLANPATNEPAVAVWSDWPEGDVKLQPPSVTVLRTGEPEIIDFEPHLSDDVAPLYLSGNLWQYTYVIAEAEMPLELELWATSKASRGDLLSRLRSALTASEDVTLAAYIAATNAATPGAIGQHDPISNEILLQLPAPFLTIASYYFEKARLYETTTDGPAGKREWRAAFVGSATFEITQARVSPALSSVVLQTQVSQDPAFKQNGGGIYQTTIATGGPGQPAKTTYQRG